jgi:hypothetical protein
MSIVAVIGQMPLFRRVSYFIQTRGTDKFPRLGVMTMGKSYLDRTDYSVVVKNRLPHPGSWKGESVRQTPLRPP